MLLLLLPAAACAGLLGGLTGAGGPPLMVVYSLLQLEKDLLRGFGVVPSVDMLVRLGMYTASEEAVFDAANEGWLYIGILLGAMGGISLGTWFRKWVSSEGVVVVILFLVYCASALMLGVGQGGAFTTYFFLQTFLTAGAFTTCYLYPHAFILFRGLCCCRWSSRQLWLGGWQRV